MIVTNKVSIIQVELGLNESYQVRLNNHIIFHIYMSLGKHEDMEIRQSKFWFDNFDKAVLYYDKHLHLFVVITNLISQEGTISILDQQTVAKDVAFVLNEWLKESVPPIHYTSKRTKGEDNDGKQKH